MQGVSLGGPAVVDALGVVKGGVGAQRVELMPGQVVPGDQPQRGVRRVPALGDVVRIAGRGGLTDARMLEGGTMESQRRAVVRA